jgi:hypothetical protein
MITMSETEFDLEKMPGDGGTMPAPKGLVAKLQKEVQDLSGDTLGNSLAERQYSEDARYCRWEGQSPDGRKHRDDMPDEEEPFPWEGASDARVRLVDDVINDQVILLVAAATRFTVKLEGRSTVDEGEARRWEMVLKWLRKSCWKGRYRREIERLVQWMLGDSPGASVMGVYQEQEWQLHPQELSIDRFVELMTMVNGPRWTPEVEEDFREMLSDPDREEEALEFLAELLPALRKRTLKKAVRELRESGTTFIPAPALTVNYPTICAHRLYEDIFVPDGTEDIQRARLILVREWLSPVELASRVSGYAYSERFVTDAMEHKGESGFITADDQVERRVVGDASLSGYVRTTTRKRDNEVEVITAYWRASNEDGVMGIYRVSFHHAVEEPATQVELMSYKHGMYPFVWFGRENLTRNLLDTRGWGELLMSDQDSLKRLHDSFQDHTSISTVPPMEVSGNRPRMRIVIGPNAQIRTKRKGEVSWFETPPEPRTNKDHQRNIERRVNGYAGRPDPEVDPGLIVAKQQHLVDGFLGSLADVYSMCLQLSQQYLSDEQVERITGKIPELQARSREEIQGQFDMTLSFDARAMNLDYIKEVAATIGELVLPMDTDGVVLRGKMVRHLMAGVDPILAEEATVPTEVAQRREIDEEEVNFTKIAAGIEPEMVEQGQNYGVRMQVLVGIIQKNPEALERMPEKSKEILKTRLAFLQHQVQQQKNAQIGRRGTEMALEKEGRGNR